MKRIALIIAVMVSFLNGGCQSYSSAVDVSYFVPNKGEEQYEIIGVDSNQIQIVFSYGFLDDSVAVYHNDKLVHSFWLKPNVGSNHSRQSFMLEKASDRNVLKVYAVNRKSYFETSIEPNFKLLDVSIDNSVWKIGYTNYVRITE